MHVASRIAAVGTQAPTPAPMRMCSAFLPQLFALFGLFFFFTPAVRACRGGGRGDPLQGGGTIGDDIDTIKHRDGGAHEHIHRCRLACFADRQAGMHTHAFKSRNEAAVPPSREKESLRMR